MPTQKKFLDLDGLIQLLLEIESLDETNIKDFYWSTDNADTYPTVVFKIGDDNGSPHTTLKITFKGDIVNPAPANATTRSITLTINNVDKTITYYDTTGSAGITYTNATDTGDPTTATNVKAALDRVINKLNSMVGTDEKVKLTALTGSTALPILTAVSGTPTSGANAEAGYDADFKFTPSSNTLIVKAATSSASGVTITPSSIKVGTTATNGAAELTPSLLKVGSGTLTSTAYSGKATQTETDLAVHSGTNDGATKVGYSSSETGYTGVTTVDGALDLIITDVNANKHLILTGNEWLSLTGGIDISPATYLDTCLKVADAIATFNTPILVPDLLGLNYVEARNLRDENGDCVEFDVTIRRGYENSTFALYIHAKKVSGTWAKQSDLKVAVNGGANASKAGYVSEGMLESTTSGSEGASLIGYTLVTEDNTTTDVTVKDALDELYATVGGSSGDSLSTRVTNLENGANLIQGSNVTLTKDTTNHTVTIAASDLKVAYTSAQTSTAVPIVLSNGATPTSPGGVKYASSALYNPSTGTATFKSVTGNGSTVSATKKVEISGDAITFTPASGTAISFSGAAGLNDYGVVKIDSTPTQNSTNAVTSGGVYSYVGDLIASYKNSEFKVATSAELTAISNGTASSLENGIIYLVPATGATSPNVYDEYIKVRTGGTDLSPTYSVEKIGTTDAGVDVVSIPATGSNSVASMFAEYVLNA